MKKIFCLTIFCLNVLMLFAQNTEEANVKKSIEQLFTGMANKDAVAIKAIMHPAARLNTASFDKQGKPLLAEETIANFIKQISEIPAGVKIEERVLSYEIRVDGNLATAWTPYQFYINEKFSHGGVDAFQLFKDETGAWKITQITDTRRK